MLRSQDLQDPTRPIRLKHSYVSEGTTERLREFNEFKKRQTVHLLDAVERHQHDTDLTELSMRLMTAISLPSLENRKFKRQAREMALDAFNRWILGEDDFSDLAHFRADTHRAVYVPGIGHLGRYMTSKRLLSVRHTLKGTDQVIIRPNVLLPEHVRTDPRPELKQGLTPRGFACDTNLTMSPTLDADKSEFWGYLTDDCGLPAIMELMSPSGITLNQQFYQLDYWRMGITAQWTVLARKLLSSVDPDWAIGWITQFDALYKPDRLILQGLVLLTRLCTVSAVAEHLEQYPEETFWIGYLLACTINDEKILKAMDQEAAATSLFRLWSALVHIQGAMKNHSPIPGTLGKTMEETMVTFRTKLAYSPYLVERIEGIFRSLPIMKSHKESMS